MSCLSGSIRMVDASVYGKMTAVDAPVVGYIECETLTASIATANNALHGSISVNAGIVGVISEICLAKGDYVIRWAKPLLEWAGDDNREGVIKYNILTASSDWSLEEIIIEELL